MSTPSAGPATATESPKPYALDNNRSTAPAMLGYLSAVMDDFTVSRLAAAGVPSGARCLELGAGIGSIAHRLTELAGENGHVIATDIKPQHVRPHERVEVLCHDVTSDELPAGPFDVIHARLLLAHLPTRRDILTRLARALAPGGMLVIEEWGAAGSGQVLAAKDPALYDLYPAYQEALLAVFREQGNDTSWSVQVNAAMVDAGLSNVDTEVHGRAWRGGTAGTMLPVAVSTELEPRLVPHGITADQLEQMRVALRHPETVVMSNLTWSTIGRNLP